jgi:hypothetical protein
LAFSLAVYFKAEYSFFKDKNQLNNSIFFQSALASNAFSLEIDFKAESLPLKNNSPLKLKIKD